MGRWRKRKKRRRWCLCPGSASTLGATRGARFAFFLDRLVFSRLLAVVRRSSSTATTNKTNQPTNKVPTLHPPNPPHTPTPPPSPIIPPSLPPPPSYPSSPPPFPFPLLSYCPGFREIGEAYGPFDVAAIPIGAYVPRWFMKDQHIDPQVGGR